MAQVVKLGTENRPLMLDRKRAEKPVLLLSLSERRSKGAGELQLLKPMQINSKVNSKVIKNQLKGVQIKSFSGL